jgi:tRNA(Ser,Leu) C12 N-acetylase TAN1
MAMLAGHMPHDTPSRAAVLMQGSYDWNVVVTAKPRGYRKTWAALLQLGVPRRTDFWNVLAMRVDDPRTCLAALQAMVSEDPALADAISHVVCAAHTFQFEDRKDFERQAAEAAGAFLSSLAGRTFHVRMHRRGLKQVLSSQNEEQFLDHFILQRLEDTGQPARITFDDPDFIVSLETIGHQAGMDLWSRDAIERFSLLGLD